VLLDHVEVTVPKGSLDDRYCADVDRLLVDILGWRGASRTLPSPVDGTPRVERVYRIKSGQFVVLREAASPLRVEDEDHIGILVRPRRLERIFAACTELARRDHRAIITWTVDGAPLSVDLGPVTIKGFMISFLLPLRLDIQTRAGLLGPFASTTADLRTWWAGRRLLGAVEKATKTPPG
jgi:hypothetical protein